LRRGSGNIIVFNEPKAIVVKEALEGFANGRFRSQAEVTRFLNSSQPFQLKGRNKFTRSCVQTLLANPFYAGYYSKSEWDIPFMRGNHDALISIETHKKILKRKEEHSNGAVRKDLNKDFPLRGFIHCEVCGRPLTAYWARSGSGKRHPYYHCYFEKCSVYGKSIRRAIIEEQFSELLRNVTPSNEIFEIATILLKEAWDNKALEVKAEQKACKQQISALETRIENSIDQMVEMDSKNAVRAYQRKLESYELERAGLLEALAKMDEPVVDFDETLELALNFLRSPWKAWENGDYRAKIVVQRLTFIEPIVFDRKDGLRTPKVAFPFKVLGDFAAAGGEMVGPVGLEPTTKAL
jgi:site-specific DNA recombinase